MYPVRTIVKFSDNTNDIIRIINYREKIYVFP